MTYDEEALQKVREDRFLIDQYDTWLFEEMEPYIGQRVLEIGCGLGNLTSHLVDRELVVGIDVSRESVSRVHARYADNPRIQAEVYDIAGPRAPELGQYGFDTAISINVFEHIEDDDLGLKNTWQLLRPGGVLLLVVPAHNWLYGSMDRAIGHHRRYGKRQLVEKLGSIGFEIHLQKYVNALGGLGWFFNGRVLKRKTPPQGQLRLLNPILPWVQWAERFVSPPLGISLFTVARRSEGDKLSAAGSPYTAGPSFGET